MKRLSHDLYVVTPGTYVDRRAGAWYVSDENSKILAGPFDSPEAARDHVEGEEAATAEADLDALDPATAVVLKPGDPGFVVFQEDDLVTLREAAGFLPVTRQALEARKRRGTLGVSPVVAGRTVELYSLKALKEALGS